MVSVGGQLNESYFKLLDLPLSESIYHLDLFRDVQLIMNPQAKQKTVEGKLATWGISMEDFDIDG